jgi:hypothetical protein
MDGACFKAGSFQYCGLTSPMLNSQWGHICARNLALTTSYTFFVRAGIEMQVSPSSTLSPQLKLSPPHDPMALDVYYRISRELKDAYPVEFNDKGKMWGVISNTFRSTILPLLSQIPGPLAQGGTKIVKGAVTLGDAIAVRRQEKRKKAGAGKKPAAYGTPQAAKSLAAPQRKK